MDFATPLSIIVPNIFFKIISIIGPTNIPITPKNLKPVYIAINVNIGCIPICFDTTLGSINCLTTLIITSKTIMLIPKVKSPSQAQIIAHGIITVALPNIGSASTKPIPSAAINGNGTFRPTNLNIYSPTSEITNETNTKIASAFR